MAISHVQPLLLLLASLFFLPALYDALKFEYCNSNAGYDFGKVTGVSTTPTKDDATTNTIYVSINATQKLNEGTVNVQLRMSGGQAMDGYFFDLHDVIDASLPVKPKTSFSLTLTKVPFETEIVRYHNVTVTLFNDEYTALGQLTKVLCINFNPWSDTESAAVSA